MNPAILSNTNTTRLSTQAAAPVVTALIITYVLVSTGFPQLNSSSLMLWIVCVYGAVRLGGFVADPNILWGGILFWLYMLFILVVPGIAQIKSETFFWFPYYRYDDSQRALASGLIICGIFLVDIGYWLPRLFRRRVERATSAFRLADFSWGWLSALLLGVVISFTTEFFILGPAEMFRLRGSTQQTDVEDLHLSTVGYVSDVLSAFSFVALCAVALRYQQRYHSVKHRRRRSLLEIIPIIFCFLFYTAMNWPARLPRFMLGAHAFIFVIAFSSVHLKKRRIAAFLTVAFFPFLLYSVFWIIGIVTRGADAGNLSNALEMYQHAAIFEHGDFDGYQMTLSAVGFVQDRGLQLGQQILSSVLFFVPRDIWSEKGLPTGSLLAVYEGTGFLNVSCSWFMEWYVDFGVVGLGIGSLFLGVVLSLIDRTLVGVVDNRNRFLAAGLAGFLPILLRGPLLGVISPVVAFAVCTIIVFGSGVWLDCLARSPSTAK